MQKSRSVQNFTSIIAVSDDCMYKLYVYIYLKETCSWFKKWPLNLWISNNTIMEVGNIKKTATFKSFLPVSYKNTQILFLWQCFLIFHEKNINQWFWGVTQKYELRVSFNVSQSYINVNKKHIALQQTCNTNLNRLKTELKEKIKNICV